MNISEAAKVIIDNMHSAVEAKDREIATLRAQNRALVEALTTYGVHLFSCATTDCNSTECSCGLDAALKLSEESQ